MVVKKYLINLGGTTENLKEFVRLTNRIPNIIDIQKDRFCVDGKSLLGIMSLDTSKNLTMVVYGDCYDYHLQEILDLFEVR